MLGKQKRLNRLFNNKSKNMILVPLDHGVSCGPIKGIEDMSETIESIVDSHVDSILLHKGMIEQNYKKLIGKETGLIMHLSASTDLGNCGLQKILVASVDEAISMGCDAVSMHINLGNSVEKYMIEDLSKVSKECYQKGMPLIAMMYARDEKGMIDEFDVNNIKHIARVAVELGADVIKLNYPRSKVEFKEIVDSCQVPIVIAGGSKKDELELLKTVSDAMQCGARGVSIGRNIFQSEYKELLIRCIREIVHEKAVYDDVKNDFLKFKKIETEILIEK